MRNLIHWYFLLELFVLSTLCCTLYWCFPGASTLLYISLAQSGILVSNCLGICIRFRLMLVAQEIITLPSTLTTWNFTLWKHWSSECSTNSSQDPITGIFCLVYVCMPSFSLGCTFIQSGSLYIILYMLAGIIFVFEHVSILALRILVFLP